MKDKELIDAATKGQLERVNSILCAGVDVDVRDEDGCTALHCALSEGFLDVAALLISKGADRSLLDSSGFTGLHWATFSNDREIMEISYIETIGANPRDALGRTPLTYAITQKASAAVCWLLEHGADPNIADDDGWTSLHYLASENLPVYLPLLLTAKVDILALSSAGETPCDVALRLGSVDAAEALRALGGGSSSPAPVSSDQN